MGYLGHDEVVGGIDSCGQNDPVTGGTIVVTKLKILFGDAERY
jgi:hypothetical protein